MAHEHDLCHAPPVDSENRGEELRALERQLNERLDSAFAELAAREQRLEAREQRLAEREEATLAAQRALGGLDEEAAACLDAAGPFSDAAVAATPAFSEARALL